jgi:putative selenium metabolism hydrolase
MRAGNSLGTARRATEMLEDLANEISLLAWKEQEYAADLLQRLIRVKSMSCEEADAIDLAKREIEGFGPDEVFIDSIGNAVARFGDGKKVVVYDSHVDTVGAGDPQNWKVEPFGGIRRDNVIYGRGASDNKAGVACMLASLRLLTQLKRRGDFTLYVACIVQEEECEGLGLSVLLEERDLAPDVVLLGECTNLNINRGHRGRVEIEVLTRGKSCHASTPEEGDNAIYRMAPVVDGIRWVQAKLQTDLFLGKGSIAVTDIECSTPSRNAVPEMCRIYIDRRIVPTDTRESVARELDRIAKFTKGEVRIADYSRPSYKGYVKEHQKFFPAWSVSETSPAVSLAARTYEFLHGKPPQVGKWAFSTDGNYSMGVRSIPTIGFGPGEERHAHSTEDQVKVDDLWKAVAFYTLFPFVYSQ